MELSINGIKLNGAIDGEIKHIGKKKKENKKRISFKESLKILNIEDYEKQIFNSNSNGELFHLNDYILLAENLKGGRLDIF